MTNLNFRTLRTLEFFFARTANAKKSILFYYLQLLKKLALYDNSLGRKKHFPTPGVKMTPPPLVVLGLMKQDFTEYLKLLHGLEFLMLAFRPFQIVSPRYERQF